MPKVRPILAAQQQQQQQQQHGPAVGRGARLQQARSSLPAASRGPAPCCRLPKRGRPGRAATEPPPLHPRGSAQALSLQRGLLPPALPGPAACGATPPCLAPPPAASGASSAAGCLPPPPAPLPTRHELHLGRVPVHQHHSLRRHPLHQLQDAARVSVRGEAQVPQLQAAAMAVAAAAAFWLAAAGVPSCMVVRSLPWPSRARAQQPSSPAHARRRCGRRAAPAARLGATRQSPIIRPPPPTPTPPPSPSQRTPCS
jgi:hypothetical protein